MGRDVLDAIFDEFRVMPEVTDLFLSFPENWTNVVEQRALYRRLGKHCPNLTKVTIKTQSVYIIQCTKAKCVRVVDSTEGCADETEEGRMWHPMTGNVINANKLNVL